MTSDDEKLKRPFDESAWPFGLTTVLVLGQGIILYLWVEEFPEEWRQRTWVGRVGLSLGVPIWTLGLILFVPMVLIEIAFGLPRFLCRLGVEWYDDRRYRAI